MGYLPLTRLVGTHQWLIDSLGLETTLILNDDVDGAEAGLDKGNSSFHEVGAISYGSVQIC